MVLIRISSILITICKVLHDLTFACLSLISSHSSLSVLFTVNCFCFGSLEFDIFLCCKGQSNIKSSELWCQKVRSPFAFNFCRKYYHIWIPRELGEKWGYLANIDKWNFFKGFFSFATQQQQQQHEDLKNPLELTPKKDVLWWHRGLECKSRKSRDT